MSHKFNIRIHACGREQNGFALVTGIFILVILAGLGAAMVTISTSQHTTVALDVQSGRAYQAARAGIEWGAYQVLQVANTCPTSPASMTPQPGFTSTVTCSVTVHPEGVNTISLYVFTSTATYGTAGSVDFIARAVSTRLARCVDGSGNPC